MKFGKRDKSIIDALFILALFAVFLICALFIVLFGAKIYKSTVKSSEVSFENRTCYTYIIEKIRQNDNLNGILISDDSDGSVITLTRNVNGKDYATYLYCDEGYLKEYTTLSDNELNKSAGTKITPLESMSAIECTPNLYKFTLKGENVDTSFHVSLTSYTGGDVNE